MSLPVLKNLLISYNVDGFVLHFNARVQTSLTEIDGKQIRICPSLRTVIQRFLPEKSTCALKCQKRNPYIIWYFASISCCLSIACLASLKRHKECLQLINQRLESESKNPDLFIMRARLHLLFCNVTSAFFSFYSSSLCSYFCILLSVLKFHYHYDDDFVKSY